MSVSGPDPMAEDLAGAPGREPPAWPPDGPPEPPAAARSGTLAGKRLALIVSTAPELGDLSRAHALAMAAAALGVDVGIFFMDEAVAGLPQARALLAELVEEGCELCACASSAHARGLGEADVGMLLGSQDDHAALVHRADRVVAFT